MRVPIFLPLLLVLAAVALVGVDVAAIVGSSEEAHAFTQRHSDDERTFVASVLYPLDEGLEVRTSGHPFHKQVVHGPEGRHEVEDPARALEGHLRFLVIPVWDLQGLAANGTATVLHESSDAMGPQTFLLDDLPAPPPRPDDGHDNGTGLTLLTTNGTLSGESGEWRVTDTNGTPAPTEGRSRTIPSVALVWLLENDTADYADLSRLLLEDGVEGSGTGRPVIIAVDHAVMARDPWLRGAAALLSLAALVLAVLPRVRMLPAALPEGPAGAGIELAAAGRRFLASLRNAYVALAAAVLLLGVPLILSLHLFAGNAAAGDAAFGEPREQPYVGWHLSLWGLLVLTLLAGVAAAARPAVEAHLAHRRWRRREQAPPVEGDLDQ